MPETFTSAGCGGRTRRIAALGFFTAGALAAAATLGALLGYAGGLLPSQAALIGAAVLALAGALREAGPLRFRLPELRRQVPEPWRRRLPLPVWSTGYGVILGSGFGTFQPVATFWVACAGAVALGDVARGAACLAVFGAGRAVMLVAPGPDPVGTLVRTHRLVRPANAVVLILLACLLGPAGVRAAVPPPPPPSGQSDPSVSQGAIAYTDQLNGLRNVAVLERGSAAPVVFPNGRMPSLSTQGLAYVTDSGIRVVLWRTGQEVFRVPGRVDKPALSGQRLAYVERIGARARLVTRTISGGSPRVITSVGPGVDLGRPALSGRWLAWHEARGDRNQILLRNLDSGRTSIVASASRSGLEVNPALGAGHIAWVEGRAERSTILVRPITGGRVRRVATTSGPQFHFWHTAIDRNRVYVTRWSLNTTRAVILRYAWTR
jgi:hypothetical protein